MLTRDNKTVLYTYIFFRGNFLRSILVSHMQRIRWEENSDGDGLVYCTDCGDGFVVCILNIFNFCQVLMAHAFNPRTGGKGSWTSASLRPAWSTKLVLGWPRLHKETLFQKTKTKTKGKENRHPCCALILNKSHTLEIYKRFAAGCGDVCLQSLPLGGWGRSGCTSQAWHTAFSSPSPVVSISHPGFPCSSGGSRMCLVGSMKEGFPWNVKKGKQNKTPKTLCISEAREMGKCLSGTLTFQKTMPKS